MKTLNFLEIQSIVEMINETIESSPLQDVYCVDEKLSFGFYKNHKVQWVVVDLNSTWPFIGLFPDPYKSGPKTVKPVVLFINSRFKNRWLRRIQIQSEGERVIQFIFDDEGFWEFRAIPGHANLICRDQKKIISWNKVIDRMGGHSISFEQLKDTLEVRSINVIFSLWQRLNVKFEKNSVQGAANSGLSAFDKWKKQRVKDLTKKTQALEKLKVQVDNPLILIYQQIGEHLKSYGYKNLELEWPQHIDVKKRVSENIEICFLKSKQLKSKSLGAQKRIDVLKDEIDQIKDLSAEAFDRELEGRRQKSTQSVLPRKDDLKIETRKKIIDEKLDVTCYMGKSAQENVKLFKAAKSWHIWIHLKDYPSAYAIIFCGKNVRLSDQHIRIASQWFTEESFRHKKETPGTKVKVIFTECRHVKLIKGDRLGRVTYSLAKELVISL